MEGEAVRQLADQALDRLGAALAAGQSDELRRYLAAMSRFHRYSVRNLLLITAACPHATRVAGYRAWQRLGRQVKSGERGIAILAPIVLRKANSSEDEVVAFRSATVFDISQTDGADLPSPARARGEPGEYTNRLTQFIIDRGITLEYSEVLGSAEGLCVGQKIVVRANLAPAEEFSVLVHELAHALLHQSRNGTPDRAVRELEAEAVAFVVGEAIGLDGAAASSEYIQLYRGDRKMLFESLRRIQQTAARIIDGIQDENGRQLVESESPGPVQAAAA